ncbi:MULTISPECIES: HD-GYP domain-containing protein [Comamonadaceae]|uniref:HD-GYP domain-containing protein n=1 Tax=Comamonadaceae TaxID=80864 RepID=UPI002731ACBC|nr:MULTISPECIES: HD domain-containing phosphohydrolase [Comamonadaceae]MDP1529708.1 response regulator [Rhodoferax sp.]MDP1945313.1 response regulator [Rhodoferax sp.]MDP2441397.1 response regulator [Rhodoferax sp.]MDP3191480.1 response regulator [Rhodoferax sp.]MDP3347768.1 response regulator [Hydrogenophaga sp.]
MNGQNLRTECILIVDDEPANLKLLDKMLGGQGYQNLVLVADPREVIDRYRTARPDLILLDINMPHLDGYQVMTQLKALNDPLLPPIVILTAQHGKDYLLRALAAGARDFIGKPFDRNELLMRVRNLLDAQLAHRMVHDQKAVLEEMVRARTEELHRTRLQVVQRLGMAAEYRDEETGYHILRMSHVCALLARAVGWSELDCDLILSASPMHDIGKIGIPDAIMLKPGKFEPHEWDIMKTHATIGAKLLDGDDSTLMRMAREIAVTHHEKWDGSGYPNGLAGEAIPQAGRIAALADVFDALTSVRPYKKAWTVEAAVDLIKANSGQHFDPQLVEVLLQELAGIVAIRERFAEPGM